MATLGDMSNSPQSEIEDELMDRGLRTATPMVLGMHRAHCGREGWGISERLLALLGALVPRFNGLEEELEAQD